MSLCFAQVKNAKRSLGSATPRSFHSRVWRNWQLGERAHPVGDEASSIKAQKQGEFRADARKATMLQESRGHFFENLRDNAKRCCSIFSKKICGCLCASHK